MRIYLASRYSRREELLGYREDIERLGLHVVTSRWLNGNHQIDDCGLSNAAKAKERERFASEDFEDVATSHLVISFTESPRSTISRGGRHVEHGIALGKGLGVWIVGPRENVFHCLPCVRRFAEWTDALHALRTNDPIYRPRGGEYVKLRAWCPECDRETEHTIISPTCRECRDCGELTADIVA